MDERDRLVFRKSSFSGNGDCLEWAWDGGTVFVRDSKNLQGLVLAAPASDWKHFANCVLSGRVPTKSLRYQKGKSGVLVFLRQEAGELAFSASEWLAFRRAVAAGEVLTTAPLPI